MSAENMPKFGKTAEFGARRKTTTYTVLNVKIYNRSVQQVSNKSKSRIFFMSRAA
jgi:hypothetical protein